ncbi:nucleotidyltransferase domain-containing protein [bacterium]|nr:nucleotidyltransferase domain-containing protein [bacterium]
MARGLSKYLAENLGPKEKEAILSFVNLVTERYRDKVEFIYLFGSRARGEGGKGSDIDLLICVDEWKNKYLDELSDLSFDFILDYNLLLSPIIYDKKEWLEENEAGTPFIRSVRREGIELWKRRRSTLRLK